MELSLGFSPCPNDTFIFDALVHEKIDTEGIKFNVTIADVEALNRHAFAGKLAITKLSFHALAHLLSQYQLLNTGSALGNKCGPLLVGKRIIPADQIQYARVAIPGKMTTANFLLSLAFPELQHREEMIFSEIEQAVVDGTVDAGLIIHENRFTYQQKGLIQLLDLGEFWESSTQLPIPLGAIAIKRSLPIELRQRVDRVLQRSVAYAMDHPDASTDYVHAYAQTMSDEVMRQHINLYVNDYTLHLGTEGRQAIRTLFDKAQASGIAPEVDQELFVPMRVTPA